MILSYWKNKNFNEVGRWMMPDRMIVTEKKKRNSKKQHYVSQSYVKRFTRDGKQLYVFDKFDDKAFGPINVREIAHENYFYDIPEEAILNAATATSIESQSAEKALAVLDGEFNEIIEVALKFAKGGTATSEQRMKMSLCAAVQLIRTRDFREESVQSMEQFRRSVLGAVLKLSDPDLARKVLVEVKYNKDSLSVLHSQFLWNPEFIGKVAAELCNHIWLIGINQTTTPLYTSDTPVVRRAHMPQPQLVTHPDRRPAYEKAIGIAFEPERRGIVSEGVEIIFPLSAECTLIFLERTYFKSLEEKDGGRFALSVAHVEEFNRLQVLQSHRQVYSTLNDFRLAEDVCIEHPEACSQNRERLRVITWERANPPHG